MGLYLNPGNEKFKEILNGDNYIDKTLFINVTNNKLNKMPGKLMSVSRPRRFGKTFTQNMLCAYYSKGCDSKALFNNLNIAKEESYSTYLNKFNVVKIDIGGMYAKETDKNEFFIRLNKEIKKEFVLEFPNIDFTDYNTLSQFITTVYSKTKEQFIVIFDEYDRIFREEKVTEEIRIKYLDFLDGMFKEDTTIEALALAYLTGILPVIKEKSESKLNDFKKYSMLEPKEIAQYIGFTEDEVKGLCQKYDMDFEEMKGWYDGYKLGNYSLYNPMSVLDAIDNNLCDNYWSKTGTIDVILNYINSNYEAHQDILDLMSGKKIKVNTSTFRNDPSKISSRDEMLTYLIHLGYLAYDIDKLKRKYCRIPNYEIKLEWESALATTTNNNNVKFSFITAWVDISSDLLEAIWNKNEEEVSSKLNEAHNKIGDPRNFDNEGALKASMILAMAFAETMYDVYKEIPSSIGYADLVYKPKTRYVGTYPAIIIELKIDKTPSKALEQIENKEYFNALVGYTGSVLLVGISYSKENNLHTCMIKEYYKEK